MEPTEMRLRRLPLDDATADRLAAGDVAPSDAPPGYEGVARLLSDAGFADQEAPLDGELLAAMVQAVQSSPADVRTPSMLTKLRSAKVATLAAAVVLSTAGAAAAATGHLPDPAQDAVHRTGRHLGIDLPAAGDDHRIDDPATDDPATHDVGDDHGADDPATHDVGDDHRSDGHGADDLAPHDAGDDHEGDRHGDDVSDTARSTEPGPDHGATVSSVATDNHGHGPGSGGPGSGGATTTTTPGSTSTTVQAEEGHRGTGGGDDGRGHDAADDRGGRIGTGGSQDG